MVRIVIAALVASMVIPTAARADDWPQWMGPNRNDRWRETGILAKFPQGGPKLLWRTKIHGGYSGPAVVAGRVYVMDYDTSADIRHKDVSSPMRPRAALKGKERVLCLDARTGKELWKHEYDCPYSVSYPAGPRCTPTVSGGKVYTLGAMGNLYCLDARKGTVLWLKDFKKAYLVDAPLWGFTGHPLVDGKKVFCTVNGRESLLVALDKDTGKELWRAGNATMPSYCPPSIITAGGKKQLLLWDPEKINSLDPETGKEYWTYPLKPKYDMAIMAPQKRGDYLFTAGVGGAGVMLKLDAGKPAVTKEWIGKQNTGLYPVNSTPIVESDTIYGIDERGQLRAVDIKTGKRLWDTLKPITPDGPANSVTAFLVKNGDRFFLFNEKGELLIARLSRKGYEEIDRAKLLAPTGLVFGRDVVWSHPAFANKCVFARNDKEIVCYSLAAE